MVDRIYIVKRSVSNVKCHWNNRIITDYAQQVVDLADKHHDEASKPCLNVRFSHHSDSFIVLIMELGSGRIEGVEKWAPQ
jgi:hypothetical protein